MRVLALMLVAVSTVLSGCSLYFGGVDPVPVEPPPDAQVIPQDAPPYPDPFGLAQARCEDGQLYIVDVGSTFQEAPGHGAGRVVGRCEGACRSAAVVCPGGRCPEAARALCDAPPSLGATCSLDGAACRTGEALSCPETTTCGFAVPGSSCTCVNGAYDCTQSTPAARIQQALVGKWRGMVTTPGFAPPYAISLWIYPDGSYWAECPSAGCTAFYYGGDGPSSHRRITILSASSTVGAWADIAIDFGDLTGRSPPNIGALNGLVVDATTLRFTFNASWHGCGQPFEFRLTRE